MVSDAQCQAECNARYVQSILQRFLIQVENKSLEYVSGGAHPLTVAESIMSSYGRIKAAYVAALERA